MLTVALLQKSFDAINSNLIIISRSCETRSRCLYRASACACECISAYGGNALKGGSKAGSVVHLFFLDSLSVSDHERMGICTHGRI